MIDYDRLKPCPFCGGKSTVARETHRPTRQLQTRFDGGFTIADPIVNDGWLIECEKCGARGPHEYTDPVQTMGQAAVAWNRREPDAQTSFIAELI